MSRREAETLPSELLDFVQSKIAAGAQAGESEVVSEGLRMLVSSEDPLRDELAPTFERAIAEPDSLADLAEAFDGIRAGIKASDF